MRINYKNTLKKYLKFTVKLYWIKLVLKISFTEKKIDTLSMININYKKKSIKYLDKIESDNLLVIVNNCKKKD